MNNNLPIHAIFEESIGLSMRRFNDILRIGWPYFLILFVSIMFPDQISGLAELIVFYILFTTTSVLAIVGCHRIFLMSQKEVNQTSTIRWSMRESRFLINSIGLSLIAAVFGVPFLFVLTNVSLFEQIMIDEGIAFDLLSVLFTLPSIYIMCRLSLIFPDVAVDHDRDRSLAWAWKISSGHSTRLFLLIGMAPLTAWTALELIVGILGDSLIIVAVEAIIWVGISVIEVCLLSLSYRWLVFQSDNLE